MSLVKSMFSSIVGDYNTPDHAAVHATSTVMVIFLFILFALSELNKNYSWVSRFWSILPVVYTLISVCYTLEEQKKSSMSHYTLCNTATLFAAIVTFWGVRLTYNYARRGGYTVGHQDYRWNYVRNLPVFRSSPLLWSVFNFVVISLFQMLLIWSITLPIVSIPAKPICPRAVILAAIMIMFCGLEFVADEQQHHFQTEKRVSRRNDLVHGFCVTGVFGYSRHFDLFCTCCFYVTLAVAAVCLGKDVRWWQLVGCVINFASAYIMSTVADKLTLSRYPSYSVYQSTTPMLFPSLYSSTERTLHLLEKRRRSN